MNVVIDQNIIEFNSDRIEPQNRDASPEANITVRKMPNSSINESINCSSPRPLNLDVSPAAPYLSLQQSPYSRKTNPRSPRNFPVEQKKLEQSINLADQKIPFNVTNLKVKKKRKERPRMKKMATPKKHRKKRGSYFGKQLKFVSTNERVYNSPPKQDLGMSKKLYLLIVDRHEYGPQTKKIIQE